MTQFKKQLLWTAIIFIPIIILMLKSPRNARGDFGDVTAAGTISAQRARVSSTTAQATLNFQGGSSITQNSATSALTIYGSSVMVGGAGLASFNVQNGSFSILGNSTVTVNCASCTFRGNSGSAGSTVTIGAIQFPNNLVGGSAYIQDYPAYHLLATSVPNAAISTITIGVPASSWTYCIFSGSANAGPLGGDLFVYFNGILKDPLYAVIRTTFGAGLNNITVSSLSALGIPVFGENVSTNTSRNFRLDFIGNSKGEFKDGKIFGIAHTTATEAPVRTEVGFVWYNSNMEINTISVTFLKSSGVPSAAVFKLGSFIAVYGNKFTRVD